MLTLLASAVRSDIDRQIAWAKREVKRHTRYTVLMGILAGVAALAALGACAPLAEVSKTEQKLGAQDGPLGSLVRNPTVAYSTQCFDPRSPAVSRSVAGGGS